VAKIESKPYDCPATGFKTKCRRDNSCPEWVHIYGKHPQTEERVDLFDCARRWVPVMLIENAKVAREAGAAIESFRNEIAKGDLAHIDATERLVGQLASALETRRAPALVERPSFLRKFLSR
jgi:hypothetical protein